MLSQSDINPINNPRGIYHCSHSPKGEDHIKWHRSLSSSGQGAVGQGHGCHWWAGGHSPPSALAQPNRVNSAARVHVDIQGNVLYSSGSLKNGGETGFFCNGKVVRDVPRHVPSRCPAAWGQEAAGTRCGSHQFRRAPGTQEGSASDNGLFLTSSDLQTL